VPAGLTSGHYYNTVAPLEFNLEPIQDEIAFEVGMMMVLTKLVEIDKVEEAKESFIKNRKSMVSMIKEELLATQQYRIVSMTKRGR
jgi:hypothetical protein